jgi:hypothetical protein
MLSADDIVALIRPVKERAGDDAWCAALARLGGEAAADDAGVPDEAQSASKIDVSDPKRWLPMSIAAKRARITPRRMIDWIEDGRVRAAKLEGRVFIDATTILADPVQPSRSA